MPITLKLQQNRKQISDVIAKSAYKAFVKRISKQSVRRNIDIQSRRILEESLKSQDTYTEMVEQDGELRRELGVAESASAMNQLVQAWVDSTTVTIVPPKIAGNKISGVILTITAIYADFKDVINQAYASYTTEKGKNIPWLDWLLTRGSEFLIKGYDAEVSEKFGSVSRTGTNTIMVRTKGNAWGVPEEYSGIPTDNYATKAVAAALPQIEEVIKKELLR